MNVKDKVVCEIGVPATLELCAEECVELAHACLKLARKMRGENPTPKQTDICISELSEEMGDVMLCMDMIFETGLISHESAESWYMVKESRMYQRITEDENDRVRSRNDILARYMKGE